MPKNESIRNTANNSNGILASAARQSAPCNPSCNLTSNLPFKGMEGPRDPFLVAVALNIHKFFPRAEWIRVKHLSNGRIIITLKSAGLKAHAKGYNYVNAQMNLILRIFSRPDLWKAIN